MTSSSKYLNNVMQIWFSVDDYRIMNHVLKLVRTTVFSQESDFKPWPFRMAKKKKKKKAY